MQDKQSFFVEGTDGRKFKMVIRGDLGMLSVSKIYRYLKSYGVPDGQILTYNGLVLNEGMVGNDFDLASDVVLKLHDPSSKNLAVSSTNNSAREASHQKAPVAGGVYPASRGSPRDGGWMASEPVEAKPPTRGQTGTAQTIARLESENEQLSYHVTELQEEIEKLKSKMTAQGSSSAFRSSGDGARKKKDLIQVARENIQQLSAELGVSLQLDSNMTCVIGNNDKFTILVTVDIATERIYLYSTLLNHLPEDQAARVMLYEILLEGSLLGREVCGGGIGISLQNKVVILTTSIPLAHCDGGSLKDIVPPFIETLIRWRSVVNDLIG